MEQNTLTLRRAIAQLPEYQPPDTLWQDIEAQLDFDKKLEAPLLKMPVYEPPVTVWEALIERMEQSPEWKSKPRFRGKWVIGVLLLAIALAWWMLQPHPVPTPTPASAPVPAEPLPIAQAPQIPQPAPAQKKKALASAPRSAPAPQTQRSYRTEVADLALMAACKNTDDPEPYQLVETLCKAALPVCEAPEFKQLKAELDELTLAQHELKNALGNFADDPELVTQFVAIEHARQQILQQLIAMM